MHRILAGNADLGGGEGETLGNEDLGPHQIHAGDHLGDSVLHLDAGIHLNEVVIAVFVHQEFHRARGDVAHVPGHLDGVRIELGAGSLRHAPGGGELHHFLIAALERAVPLVQVHYVAMLVAQDLDLDMFGFHQVFFDKDILVAEGLFGLALYQMKGGDDLFRLVAAPHP